MADHPNIEELKARLKAPLAKKLVAALEAAKVSGSPVDAALETVAAERLAEIKAELKS